MKEKLSSEEYLKRKWMVLIPISLFLLSFQTAKGDLCALWVDCAHGNINCYQAGRHCYGSSSPCGGGAIIGDCYCQCDSKTADYKSCSCGGGGGPGGGCPWLKILNGREGWFEENTLLPSSEWSGGKDVTDYYLIKNPLDTLHSLYHLIIIEHWNYYSYFDQVRLLTVDHSESLSIGTTFDEKILAWSFTKAPDFCIDNYNNDQLAKILYDDGDCYIGEKDDYTYTRFYRCGRNTWLG